MTAYGIASLALAGALATWVLAIAGFAVSCIATSLALKALRRMFRA